MESNLKQFQILLLLKVMMSLFDGIMPTKKEEKLKNNYIDKPSGYT
jgi:hypothetical protein